MNAHLTVNSKDLIEFEQGSITVLDEMAASDHHSYLVTDEEREGEKWILKHDIDHAHAKVPAMAWHIPDQEIFLSKDNRHPVKLECGRCIELAVFQHMGEKRAMTPQEIVDAVNKPKE